MLEVNYMKPLRGKKGRNFKSHKQGGGWTGYEYERSGPGASSSWDYEKEGGNVLGIANARTRFRLAREGPCKGMGGRKLRQCMRESLTGGTGDSI